MHHCMDSFSVMGQLLSEHFNFTTTRRKVGLCFNDLALFIDVRKFYLMQYYSSPFVIYVILGCQEYG